MAEREEIMRVREEEEEREGRGMEEPPFTQEEMDHIRSVGAAAEMEMRRDTRKEVEERSYSDDSGETESGDEERSGETEEGDEEGSGGTEYGVEVREEEGILSKSEEYWEKEYTEERREEEHKRRTDEIEKNRGNEEMISSIVSKGEEWRDEEGMTLSRSRVSLESRRSRKSSGGFSARSVEELQMDDEPTVNEWYEEQMAYMRESIADEEDYERRGMELREKEEMERENEENQPENVHVLRGSLHSTSTVHSSTVPHMETMQSLTVVGRESISSSSSVQREEEREDNPSLTVLHRTDGTPKSRSSSSGIGMFGGKKSGGFGFGGLGKLAGDAIGKAKAASEQLQQTALAAAADITKSSSPSAAQNVQPSPLASMRASPIGIHSALPGDVIPTGMDGLSEEERMKIMAVMACAELDAQMTPIPSLSPLPPPVSVLLPTTSPIPPGMDDLSEEEREKIKAVMACAAIDEHLAPPLAATASDMTRVQSQSEMHPISWTPSRSLVSPIGMDLISTISSSPIPPGLEDLSEEERMKIMSVMACAELEAHTGLRPSTDPFLPPLPPLPPMPTNIQPSVSPFSRLSPSSEHLSVVPSPIDIALRGLSEEERSQILSVMEQADMEGRSTTLPPVDTLEGEMQPSMYKEEYGREREMRVEEEYGREREGRVEKGKTQPEIHKEEERWSEYDESQSTYETEPFDKYGEMAASSSLDAPQYPVNESIGRLEGEWSSTYKAVPSFDSSSSLTKESGYGTTSTSVENDLVFSQPDMGLTKEEEEERRRELEEIREREIEMEEERRREERENEEEEERELRKREMEQVEEEQRRERERLRWEEDQTKEEDKDDDVLVDSSQVRDGAESRTDGCSTDDDAFAFSETAPRFQLPEGVEDWQQGTEWKVEKPRMWTTVFESDESEEVSVERDDVFPLPPSGSVASQSTHTQTAKGVPVVYRNRYSSSTREDNSPVDAIEMDEVYDNFSIAEAPPSSSSTRSIPSTVSGGFRFDRGQEIEFDSTPRPIATSSLPRASIPEISVTVHETHESDEEESGGEHTSDDEDYPDKVIAAPVAAPVSFEEVEREREVNEAAATHMLHQIQALGDEAANDEFDVQWAHSQLAKTANNKSSVDVILPSSFVPPTSSTDSDGTSRRNPFLEDDDVKVDVEELNTDYSQAAAYYAGMGSGGLINHRPGPVYTITEEDEGERVVEGDAKTVAREKARRTAAAATQAILSFYEQQKEEQRKNESTCVARTTTSITSIPHVETKTRRATKTVETSSVPSKGDANYTQFSLPSYSSSPSSSSTVTIPPSSFSSTLEEVTKDLPARIIDPALQISAVAEPTNVIDHSDRLFDSVYRNESADTKPNLLFYDDSSFISLANDAHGSSTSPSFLIPNSGDISSDESPSTPSKLKRSPAMMLPPERKSGDPIDPSSIGSHDKRTEGTDSLVVTSLPKHVSPPSVEKTTVKSTGGLKFTTRADAALSELAAAAADPAPISKAVSTSAPDTQPAPFFPDKAFQYKWMKQLEDDAEWLAASSSSQSEMGRRKLPSIPPPITSSSIRPIVSLSSSLPHSLPHSLPPSLTSPSSSLTRPSKPSAPVYITSSSMAPPPSSSAPSSSHLFSLPPQTETFSRPSSALNRSLYDLSRPSSACSTISYGVASIQAGCPFQSSSFPSKPRGVSLPSPRQPISMVGKHYRPPSVSKLPSTLARVKLKKELKEAVSRRRESLEASEIEANQRQYVVHKMLVTGLLPEPREDELPKVIPCLLPVELVEGARVTPASFPPFECAPNESVHSKREAAVSTEGAALWREERRNEQRSLSDEPRRIQSMRTEGTQTEAPLRESPLRLMRYEDERESREREREVRHQREVMETEERRRKTDDLIDATRRYFEEYDRQLREMGARGRSSAARKHLNLSSEDDALSRETRRLQILEELDRKRRERERLFGEEYGRRRDEYGSLPRMDRHRSPRSRGDYTLREGDSLPHYSYYGSLPRNLERGFGRGAHIQVDYEQAFGSGPSFFPTSRSLYDIYGDDGLAVDDITRTSNLPSRGRSLGYLDELGVDSHRLLLSAPYDSLLSAPYDYHRQSTDMISQYANYLSRQFGDSTLGGSSFDHSTLPPPAPLSIPPQREMYEPPLSDPYHPPVPSYYPPPNTPYGTLSNRQPPQSHLPPAMAPLSDPYSSSHVYSRSEANYGARPSYHSLDYGNLHRQVVPPQTWTTGGSVQRRSAAYPPTYGGDSLLAPYSLGHGYSQPLIESSCLGPSSLGRDETLRSWSNGNLNGREDALSRVYQSAGRRRAQENRANNNVSGGMCNPHTTMTSRFYDNQPKENGGVPSSFDPHQLFVTSTLGRQKRQTTFASTDDVISASGGRRRHESAYRRATSSDPPRRQGNVKRLLLLRKYKDHNIYNDLGVRVVGGKRMGTGELGAFVTAVNSARHCNTLGQIAEGDQVLEWNGVLLTGKTFEEVERIVNASTGEVEIVIKSHSDVHVPSSLSLSTRYDDRAYDTLPALRSREFSPDRAPPVPQHRSKASHPHHLSNGHLPYEQDVASPVFDVYPPVNGYSHVGVKQHQQSTIRSLDTLGHLQLALSYEHASQRLIVRVLSARGLKARDSTRGHAAPNPFVKIYLLPGRKVSHKRRTRFVPSSSDPEWNQLVEYDIAWSALPRMHLEFSLWDYDKFSENNSLGQVIVSLNDSNVLTGISRWYKIESLEMPINGQRPKKDVNVVYANGVHSTSRGPYTSSHSYNPTNLDIGYPAIK